MEEELREWTTPRPWHSWHGDDSYSMNCYGITSERCDHEYVDDDGHAQHTVALTLLQQPRYASIDAEWGANTALIVAAVNDYDRLRRIEAAVRPIARLSDDDVRDYEQGLCFFCGAGHEVIPGPRGGVTGNRQLRPIHEPTCSWAALRTALGED